MPTLNNFAAVVLAGCAVVVAAQQKVLQHRPITTTSPASGQEMFVNYCAVCHRKDGKGTGPAASALKQSPADLTVLAQKNGGKFPFNSCFRRTPWRGECTARGNREMPVWGPVLLANQSRPYQSTSIHSAVSVGHLWTGM